MRGDGNGTCFDLAGERISVSTRAHAGPLAPPLMHAHGRMPQEPWHYGERVLDLYRAYVLLHEQLVPYVRAAALTAARTGMPIIRPMCLLDPGDPRGWTVGDAYGYGPALWVRRGSIVVTYPVEHVAAGLGDVPDPERPLVATLWGSSRLDFTAARLPDGGRIGWRHGRWELPAGRDVTVVERSL